MSEKYRAAIDGIMEEVYLASDYDALAAELASEKQQLDNALSFYPARIRELEARDHCPCEDCKRARASESETGAKDG